VHGPDLPLTRRPYRRPPTLRARGLLLRAGRWSVPNNTRRGFGARDIADVGDGVEEEARRFPVPQLPEVGIKETVEKNGDAEATAKDFDAMMGDIDVGLGQ